MALVCVRGGGEGIFGGIYALHCVVIWISRCGNLFFVLREFFFPSGLLLLHNRIAKEQGQRRNNPRTDRLLERKVGILFFFFFFGEGGFFFTYVSLPVHLYAVEARRNKI